jgi:hypothetical protein
MTRRDLIALLGSTAATWPLGARAQQPERMRRIGVLMNVAANDPEAQARVAAFQQGLQQLGWTDGGNVRIEYRWGAGNADGNSENSKANRIENYERSRGIWTNLFGGSKKNSEENSEK